VARQWLGRSLLERGADRGEAAEAVRSAHGLATAMGALPLVEDLTGLARSARISLARVGEQRRRSEDDSLMASLTRREREVLGHLVAGRSYGEIARALFISEKTVSVHVSNLLRKTGTSSRAEAAAFARRHGLDALE
jgi:DNA-binding NarL/FixJ family response regulator